MQPPVEIAEYLHDTWIPYIVAFVIGVITCIKSYMGGKPCPSKNCINGKVAIITGASSGIGLQTALELAKRGGHVILACRNEDKGQEALQIIKQTVQDAKVEVKKLDVSSLKSIREFADALEVPKVDILINNAGVAFQPLKVTEEGFETHFVTNYLGHFLLTHLLLPKLKASEQGRIINVSSQAHMSGDILLDDLNHEKEYKDMEAFTQSKLALILMVRALTKRLTGTAVTINAVHPGLVRGTNQMNHSRLNNIWTIKISMLPWIWLFMKTPKQGAQTSVYAAVAPELAGVSGKYFGDCEQAQPSEKAQDDQLAESLYEISCALVDAKPVESAEEELK